MYIPDHFSIKSLEVMHRIIQTHPLGVLVAITPDFIDGIAIVGIQINIMRLEGKAKMSQNREDRDRLYAADTLFAGGAQGLGKAMLETVKESR
jgi:predicted FMN-binding regulatory protein PaiB